MAITRKQAHEIAERHAATRGATIRKVLRFDEITCQTPRVWFLDVSKCWIAYIELEAIMLRASEIIAIDPDDGHVVYEGSAGDEG